MPNTNPSSINFLKHKKIYFIISLIILLPGLFSLVRYGLKLSIDFTGGSLIEIQTKNQIPSTEIGDIAKQQGIEVSSIQTSSENTYFIRTKQIDQKQSDELVKTLNTKLQGASLSKFESVGPVVGAELTRKAILAVIIASICIIVYIAWSFRNVPKPYSSWKFGISAVIALLHDALVVLGLFSLLGHFEHVEVDALFVTAVLTVIGFSVHDTIVVFDRIRENLPKMSKSSFSDVVDFSLTETIGRSLNTSVTVILTLLALLLFGGESIRWFVAALLIGIISGTFSSIFNAAPILAMWEEKSVNAKK